MKVKQKIKSVIVAIMIMLVSVSLLGAIGLAFAKYISNQQNEAELNFYEYRIAPSEIVISPEEYTGENVTVTITTEKPGLSIQYKLEDSDEWIDYTGSFSVDKNTKVEARLVAKDFEGPITDKDVINIAVAKIGDTYYKTLEEAIKACPENAGNSVTKIEMLANTNESVIIPEGKNIILDLCGNTVTSNKEVTITVNGKFNLIDSREDGKVESTLNTAIKVGKTGSFIAGTNEVEPVVNFENPSIIGEKYGVTVEEGGEFNFYDGKISGKTNAINGTVTKVPDTYKVVISHEGEYEVATLRKTYVITFNKNSENAEIEYENQTVNSGESLKKLPTATKIGYIFDGWFTSEDGGEEITIDTIVTENVTYYAHWSSVKYIIKYNANGGTGEEKEEQAQYDKDIQILENVFVAPSGYSFKEWNTKQDGTGTSYTPKDTVKNLSFTQNEQVNLYAIWEDKQVPSTTAPTGTSTTSTITVSCNQKDEGSGINEETVQYSICIDGKWSDWQTNNTFENLKSGVEYEVKTRVTDKDGNGPTESDVGKITTKNIEIGNIELRENNEQGDIITKKTDKEDKSEPINNDIYIKITPAEIGDTTVIVKTPDGQEIKLTENSKVETKTGIYEITTETTDGTNTVKETVYVFVDKTLPTIEEITSSTTNTITVDANAKDDDSGIKEIKYVVKKGNEVIQTITKTSNDLDKTAEISGLLDNTEYTVEITVTDNAGNEATKQAIVKTEELLPGSIEFTESTSGEKITPTTNKEENRVWTNENIQTKLTPGNAGTTTYTVQKEGEEPSSKYSANTEIATTDGNYIVTVETTDTVNTKTVTYYFSVDKKLPTVTINPNGAEYTIAVNNNTANIGATLTSVDNENGSGISTNKYAWTTSKEEEPNSWLDFVSGTPVTKTANGGVYYLWTKVIDNAGNEATSIKTSKEFDVGYAVEYDLNGGNASIENQRKVHGQNLTLTNIIPTKEGFIFKGWATAIDATSPEYTGSSIYSKDESVKLYAVWSEVVASTTVNGKTTNYDSVQNAINAAETNEAVVTLLKNEIEESVTIAAGQNITLNTNGKTLKSNKTTITNYGILTIDGEGAISNTASELPTISNNGNLEITNGTISSENYQAINNYGTSSDELNPSLKIAGGIVKSTTGYSIENVSTGTIVIHKGEISGVINRNLAKIIITGGKIEHASGHAIRNFTGNIEIRGGTIISSAFHDGIWTSGTGNVLITGGTVTGGTNGVVTTDRNGEITITGGTVKATSSGKAVQTEGTVIIGNKEDSKIANIEEPIIIGSIIGIKCDDIRFYDGIIKVPSGEKTIEGKVTETPRGYRVTNGEETIEGVKYETAYLDRANVEIEFDKTEYTYTGEEIIPEIRVLDEDIVLVKGEDYDVTYTNNVDAGTATVNVILKGDYSGTKTSTFTINKVLLTPVATVNVKTYDGTREATGNIYLTGSVNSESPVVKDTFKFEFENSTSGTNKTVNVTNIELADAWKKNYALSTNTLTLTDGSINKAKLLATYEGEEITYGKNPALKVVITGFVNNEDENIADGYIAPKITNINTEVGTYTLIPTGGEATNYIFEYEAGTLVIKENMANVIVTLNSEKYVYDGEEKKPEVIVTDKNTGKVLTYEADYTIVYSDNINAGTASVTINLKGNYSGTVIETFIIERANGEGTLSIEGWTYGENANNPIVESSTNGTESVTYTYTGTKSNGEQYYSNIAPTDAGSYTVKATLAQTTNYKKIVLEQNFVIAKYIVTIPTAKTELRYTGNAQTGVESGSNYSITGNVETNAGSYETIATLSDINNYEWEDKTVDSKKISWQIAKIKLIPEATIEDKIYDGTTNASGNITLQGAVNGEKPTATATFTYETADCGEQTVNVTNITLDDNWKTNYELVTDNLEATGTINKKELIVTKADYISAYDGKAHEINITTTPSENIEIYYSTTELTSSNYNVEGSKDKITMVNSGTTTVYYYVHDLTGNYEDYESCSNSNNGTITISKVTLLVSATSNSKQYDGNTNGTGTITLEGAVNEEKPTANRNIYI